MNNRILQFLSAENISQAQFADNIGVTRASISHILSARNKPSYDFIVNTMKHYPNLNIEWLLTGRGKMYKESERKGSDYNLFINEMTSDEASAGTRNQVSDPLKVILPATDINEEDKQVVPDVNTETLNECKNIDNQPKQIVTQRNVIKIVLFFDDSTFQEF